MPYNSRKICILLMKQNYILTKFQLTVFLAVYFMHSNGNKLISTNLAKIIFTYPKFALQSIATSWAVEP
jgi:hypothetical protein